VSGPVLRAEGLTWRAGPVTILEGVDIGVSHGELLGVIGPNGAGKTTLLRLLAGLLTPSEGKVLLGGHEMRTLDSRARARKLAFMSQEISQTFPFTVLEVLLMGRYPHLGRFEQESAEDRERARRTLSYVGLAGIEDRPMNELSGGERQLVLFAKTLVQDTEVLVLDEPSSSLDIRHQDQIFSMALELASENKALVTSVHTLGVAAQYCTRLVLLDRGRVAAVGRPEEVLRSRILDPVYGVRTVVSTNASTGSLTVSVVPRRSAGRRSRVHLIGGAGSAMNLTRELHRLGFEVSGGITHEYDSDEKLWRSLGCPCETVGAFSRITEEDVQRAAPLVQAADITILCSFPIGTGNLGNLRLAGLSRSLVVLRPGPEDVPRSFFSPEGKSLFDEVSAKAVVRGYAEIIGELEEKSSD